MTVDADVVTLHFRTGPPIGAMALSISAAVVPGAKFSAITTAGPAIPRMEMPVEGLALLTILN